MNQVQGLNITAGLVQRLRQAILELPEGTLLGSEEALLARYPVSRPTLREALSALVTEELLVVRRGYGGGYYTRRPSGAMIARLAGTYLSARHSSLTDAVSASLPLRILIARLAARASDESCRRELASIIARERAIDAYERSDFLASEREVLVLLARMAGNPLVELFLTIVIAQSSRDLYAEGIYREEAFPARAKRMRPERLQLLTAIEARDEELAEVFARRCIRLIVGWMAEDGHELMDF